MRIFAKLLGAGLTASAVVLDWLWCLPPIRPSGHRRAAVGAAEHVRKGIRGKPMDYPSNKRRIVSWRGRKLSLVPDGPIDPEAFDRAEIRVLHVLKEPTMDDSVIRCVRTSILANGTIMAKPCLWKVTARRSYALQQGLPGWTEVKERENLYGPALASSAVVNLNDSIPPGTGLGTRKRTRTALRTLADVARWRWPNRKAMIESLSPTVGICGGRDAHVVLRMLLGELAEDHEGFFVWNGIPFINCYHPGFRAKKHEEEYAMFRNRCRAAGRWIYGT